MNEAYIPTAQRGDVRYVLNQPVQVHGTDGWIDGMLIGIVAPAKGEMSHMIVRLATGPEIAVVPALLRPTSELKVNLTGTFARVHLSIHDAEPVLADLFDEGEDVTVGATFWIRTTNTMPWRLVEVTSVAYLEGEEEPVYRVTCVSL